MTDWIIYYGDKTTFSSDDGEPQDAPGTNVQIIVQRHRDKREHNGLVWKSGYYKWDYENRVWLDCDLFGVWDYLLNSPGNKTVLAGRTIDADVFEEITRLAKGNGLIPLG